MATRTPVMTKLQDGDVVVVTWSGITENDDGGAVDMTRYPDRTVQAVGDFTSSGAITMQGSNDGTNWATLQDNLGTDIVLTAATQIKLIAQNPLYIRPHASAGSSVSMDVICVGVSNR